MRSPSLAKLQSTFELSKADAALIKALAKAQEDPTELQDLVETRCPKTAAYVRSLHSSPYGSRMWRTTVALHAMNDILGTHGVEALGEGSSSTPPMEYLNTGDSYGTTLIYTRKTDTLSIGNMGYYAERMNPRKRKTARSNPAKKGGGFDSLKGVKQKYDTIDVIFRKDGSEIVAIFPEPVRRRVKGMLTCYTHKEQHSTCDLGWYKKTAPAKASEARALLRELKQVYKPNKLRVVKRLMSK